MSYFAISLIDDQFRGSLTCKIDSFKSDILQSPFIIDTGASFSLFSANFLLCGDNILEYKKRSILGKREFLYGMGVGSYEDNKNLEYRYRNYCNGLSLDSDLFNDIMNCNTALFRYRLEDLRLLGIPIDCNEVWVSFDYIYDSLIGMDILSKLDMHMGISVCDVPFEVEKDCFSVVASLDPYDSAYLNVLNKVFNKTDSSIHLSEELNNAFSRIVNR